MNSVNTNTIGFVTIPTFLINTNEFVWNIIKIYEI